MAVVAERINGFSASDDGELMKTIAQCIHVHIGMCLYWIILICMYLHI